VASLANGGGRLAERPFRAPPSNVIIRSVIRIRVRNARLVDDLVETLRGAECIATVIDPHTCGVALPNDIDRAEAHTEMRFFLRAWQRKHGDAEVLLLA
jgi:hypothetical protein